MKCGVAGATGYLGAELLRLLADHPTLDVAVAQADTTAGAKIGDVYPALGRAYRDLLVESLDTGPLEQLDVVFVALPSGTSQELVAALAGRVRLVVDLGADFRLQDASAYPRWYGWEHSVPELLSRAVYGLPELYRRQLVGAELIAAPGCYVTAAAIALQPLVAGGLVQPSGIIVDGASGTSGGGKSPAANFHHPLANERFVPYGVLDHRHTPEMEQVIGAEVLFTPHLAPMTRGILTTCYARPAAAVTTESLLQSLAETYAGDQFVNVTAALPSTADAYGSNVVHVTARADDRTGWVVAISAIDNLVKGGSGQAIQAANVALGLPETAGLPLVGLSP
ncbi:MAG: N-acetyl-gamma-glutamyl-phosphate reductase [Acidimicrobiales bacterium]|jgi:N-acetyl-gamma-glutamyl-phosphate reductase